MRLVPALDWARSGGATGRPRSLAVGVIAASAGLVLVAGCRVPGTSASAAEPTGSGTITVVAAPGVADAPLFVGITNGLFRQAGLTVKVITPPSFQAEISDLASGRADVAFGDYADMFYAEQSKSPKLDIVANGYDAAPSVMEVLTLPTAKDPITSPAGLVGRVVGTPAPQELPVTSASNPEPDNLESIATWSVLSADNVDPTKIHWHSMEPQYLAGALGKGRVAAILATEPTIYEAESVYGAVPVLDSCTGNTASLPLDGYFTTAKWASGNATNLAAFKAALLKAQADANQSAPVQSALMHYAGMGVQTASLVTLGTYPTAIQDADLQRVAFLMFQFNTLPSGTLNVTSMIPKPSKQ
jgi:NitT/TauT family transport system substrate-binding protein